MAPRGTLDVLLALVGTSSREPLDPGALTDRLARVGANARPDGVLTKLLALEDSGHVTIHRGGGYRFALTPSGEQAAFDLGPGQRIEATIVLVDLVGFVQFTHDEGDDAAYHAAKTLHDVARDVLSARSGRLVKELGDAVLGVLPPAQDPVEAVMAIVRRCRRPNGAPWPVRAAARRGRPIAHRGDLFGADVNVAARLCQLASVDELVLSGDDRQGSEQIAVRGLADPIPITRVQLR